MIGIIRADASSSAEPNDWVNAPASEFQPSWRIVALISSATACQRSARSLARSGSESTVARSNATQHISLE